MKKRTQPIRTLRAGLVFGGLFISLSALFAAPKLSTGVAKGVASEWQKVTLPKSYKSMVVIATPNYSKKSVPIVARVRNAKGKSFELMAQNPKGKSVKAVDVYYMVVEEGIYSKKKDGVTMEAVKVSIKSTDRSGSWKGQKQSYKNKYKKPVVLGQVMSANDKNWSVFWASDGGTGAHNAKKLTIGKHVAEDKNTKRKTETVGYVVIESGPGKINGKAFFADSVTGVWGLKKVKADIKGLKKASVGVISQTGMKGNDGSWPFLIDKKPVSAKRVYVSVDEDTINDSERGHAPEIVCYIVFE